MINDKVERKLYVNIICFVIIGLVLLTNIFHNYFSKLLYLKPDIIETSATQIHFISVGQGDAIAIRFASGETMLIDSGTELYRKKLTRYLDNVVLEDNRIDYLVLTHTDLDHSSNMEYIINNYDIGTFYRPPVYSKDEGKANYITSDSYAKIINLLKSKSIEIKFNDDDNTLTCGTAKISWLYPNIDDYIDASVTNNHSAVIIIEDNGSKAMFTGDIDSSVETSILNTYSENILDVDILKIAHHGSKTSTTMDFLETTSPDYAIVSVGDNTYGHPSDEVISRIIDYDCNNNRDLYNHLYRTDIDGNIIITLGDDIIVEKLDNIDKYSFSPYWMYSILIAIFLAVIMFMPYIRLGYRTIRFIIVNARHKKKMIKNSQNQTIENK